MSGEVRRLPIGSHSRTYKLTQGSLVRVESIDRSWGIFCHNINVGENSR